MGPCYKLSRNALVILLILLLFSTVEGAYAGENRWTSQGPYGGDIRALAIDPTVTSTMYAGTFGGGIFKSLDGGATWGGVNFGLTNLLIVALRIDPIAPNVLYAGTFGGGVFKSIDGGATWGAINNGLLNFDRSGISDFPRCLYDPLCWYAGWRF